MKINICKNVLKKLKDPQTKKAEKEFIRCCHKCGQLNCKHSEMSKCSQCGQSFLPTNYFKKVHSIKGYDYKDLFDNAENIEHSLLLKGLTVIW